MPYRPRVSLATIISNLGLTSGLKLCLDAGDSASYTSGQSWLDTSGNGYDFFRGATGSATTDDPTFNGTPGALTASEYWSFDGDDFFTYDSTNEAWMNNIHKDGATFTIVVWAYLGAANSQGLVGTGVSGGGKTGFYFSSSSGGLLSFVVATGAGVALNQTGPALVGTGQWVMFTLSVAENGGATAGFFGQNNSFSTFNPAYTAPSAAAATDTFGIGRRGATEGILSAGGRVAMVAIWEGVTLTQAQVLSIYNATIAASSAPVFHKTTRFFSRRY